MVNINLKIMLIASQNLSKYNVDLPNDTVYRINLAWINDLKTLEKILDEHKDHKIFLDLPRNRTKPPNNKYSMDELKPILQSFDNIKYFAVSNIDSGDALSPFLNYFNDDIVIVPKIESPLGVKNIEEITKLLGSEKVIMLDHDDLYSSILKSNDDPNDFQIYIKSLIDFCNNNNVTLLRTIGVIFGDSEKRISEYVQ
jgi:hypothetical protein